MPNQRELNLKKYDISEARYLELKNFCLQYSEKKDRLRSMCEISAITYSGMPSGNGTGDRTAKQAESRVQLASDLELIEQTAIQADGELYQYILKNVADGIGYKYLDVPCGKKQFFAIKKQFFRILDGKRG